MDMSNFLKSSKLQLTNPDTMDSYSYLYGGNLRVYHHKQNPIYTLHMYT